MAKKNSKHVLNDKANDVSYGRANDIIIARGGDDDVSGGGGNDRINGGDGNDILKGGAGDDRLKGGVGNDVLLGGAGDDVLSGGVGEDEINGGEGDDTVVIAGNFADATIEKTTDGYKITTASGVTTVTAIELFKFADQTVLEKDLMGPEAGTTFTLTTISGENIPGTDGNDIINGEVGGGATLNNFDVVAGGLGNDTFNLVVNGVYAFPGSASVSGIETVNVNVENAAGGTIDAADFVGSTVIHQLGANAIDIEGLTNQSVSFDETVANVEFAATATSATVVLDSIDDGQFLNIDGVDLTSLTVSGSVTVPGVGLQAYLEISSTVENLGTPANDGSNITSLTVSLSSDTYLELANLMNNDAFITVDASGSTGGIEFTTDFYGDNGISTVLTGSGKDDVYFDQDYAGLGDGGVNVTINVGSGNDIVSYAAYGNVDAVAASVTLGTGVDQFVLVEQFDNVVDASSTQFTDSIISVKDFNTAEDVFDLSNFGFTLGVFSNAEKAAINDSASLFDAIELAANTLGGGEDAALFEYKGNAYFLGDTNGSGTFDDNDGLIELVGVDVNSFNAGSLLV